MSIGDNKILKSKVKNSTITSDISKSEKKFICLFDESSANGLQFFLSKKKFLLNGLILNVLLFRV